MYELDKTLNRKLVSSILERFSSKYYKWEQIKESTNFTIHSSNIGSLITNKIPVYLTKFTFESIYPFEMIFELLSNPEQIQKWDKSITLCEVVGNIENYSTLVHTVYKESFLLKTREFIEKRFILSPSKKSESNKKVLLYSSSIPNKF